MKYKFSLLAPHPDDEFIGCKKLIQKYGHNFNCIVFLTNGERNPNEFSDPIQYAKQRRKESTLWLKKNLPHTYIHYVNIPDGFAFSKDKDFIEIFNQTNDKDIVSFLVDKIKNIVNDDILILPNIDNHSSHILTHQLGMMLDNKKIFYHIHDILSLYVNKPEGIYTKIFKIMKNTFYGYIYVYSDEGWEKRNKEFATHYPSQYASFVKSGMILGNVEYYISAIPLKLYDKNRLYSIDELKLSFPNKNRAIFTGNTTQKDRDFGEEDEYI